MKFERGDFRPGMTFPLHRLVKFLHMGRFVSSPAQEIVVLININ